MAGAKEIDLQFKFFDDGMNSADVAADVGTRYMGRAQHDIRNGWKQVADCLDFMLHSKKPRPGTQGFADTFTTTLRGLGTYLRHDGTEYLLAVSGGILYSIDTTTGALTALFTLTGTGEAWFASYMDKCFVCNGTKVVKVEGTNSYQLGITAPVGVTSALAAGGTLPDGAYQIYVSYTRKVSGVRCLHSTGVAVTGRTCGTGNNTITITFPASTDSQVTHVTVWMTDAGGATYYYYGEAAHDAGSVNISSNANRDTSLIYDVEAKENDSVPAFEYIRCHNQYLYGSITNTLYRSLQVGNVYDLERFDTGTTGNKATYPFEIHGVFAIGADLILNTPGGMIRIPQGDYNNPIDIRQGYFDYPRTVVEWNQGLFGLTKQGLRFFDGEKMQATDISKDIKSVVDAIVSDATTDCQPSACIITDNGRTEYHLGYRSDAIGRATNNRQFVLNLDRLYFAEGNVPHAPIEIWSIGFNYMCALKSGAWYAGQSHSAKSIIFREYDSDVLDKNVYRGDTLESSAEYGWSLTTATVIPNLKGRIRCLTIWLHATFAYTVYVKVVIPQYPQIAETSEITQGEGASRFGISRFGIARFTPEKPIDKKKPLKADLKGKAVYIQFYQVDADKQFQFVDSMLKCALTEGRFT